MFFKAAPILLALAGLAEGATLAEAIQNGDRASIARLIKQQEGINQAEADGSTPLHWAVRNDDAATVALLLKAGANASAANRLGVTPLALAALNRNHVIAEQLLKAGANPNAAENGGQTVLMAAAKTGDSKLIELLVEHKASVSAAEGQYGETALMIAAAENQGDAVTALVRHGAEINGRSRELTYAKDRFGLEGVLTILPKGRWTPMMYAARQGASNAVRALTDLGADVNLADPEGSTSLLLAIINGHFDTAALLVEKGANPNAADNAGMTPIYAATDMNTLGEIFGRPLRAPSGEKNALDLMKLLLDRGANPNAGLKSATLQRAHTPGEPTLGEGATPLMRAAKNGDSAAIELLISRGADASLAAKNGVTPLMFAAGLGRGVSAFAKDYGTEADLLSAAKLLVAHGADVNAISAAGLTAVHYAAGATDANFPPPTDAMLQFLLEKGANVNVTDKQGRTPVDMALGKGLRGRAGGPVKPREQTAEMLRLLQNSK